MAQPPPPLHIPPLATGSFTPLPQLWTRGRRWWCSPFPPPALAAALWRWRAELSSPAGRRRWGGEQRAGECFPPLHFKSIVMSNSVPHPQDPGDSEQYHWTTYLLTIQCPAKPVAFVFGGTTVVPDNTKVVGASLHEWYGVRGHCRTPPKRVVWIPWAMGALSI